MPNTENVVTFRCGDDLLEEIDAAADSSRFDTRAAFLRWHLEETIGEPYTDGAESDRSALAERIDELEEQLTDVVGRLEQLEGESDEPETSVVELNQFDSKQGDSHELEYAGESIREREPLFESARDDEEINAALEGFDPGRGPNERKERRESAQAALQWLRDQQGGVTAGDVKRALYDRVGVDGQTEQTWWTETARAAYQHAASNGYVEIDGRSYEWVRE